MAANAVRFSCGEVRRKGKGGTKGSFFVLEFSPLLFPFLLFLLLLLFNCWSVVLVSTFPVIFFFCVVSMVHYVLVSPSVIYRRRSSNRTFCMFDILT